LEAAVEEALKPAEAAVEAALLQVRLQLAINRTRL
jgi:hypothetical protein